ncbi:MAG: beta-hexosaminidase [Clostridiales bacterium]|nr:beta-hexosaminidase [Clostridiales bacterium]
MKKKKIITATVITAVLLVAALYAATNIPLPSQNATLTEFLDSRHDPQVEALLDDMTIEEKAGQLFMGCFYTTVPSPETVKKYNLGMALFFGKSFTGATPNSILTGIKAIQASSKIELMFAVDEEGGPVNRVSLYPAFRSSEFRAPRDIYTQGGMEAIVSDIHEKNALLSSIGINLNLAPVCDISTVSSDFMYSRSLGQNAAVTSQYAAESVMAYRDDNMGCSLKHFPGYGNVADTHNGFAVDNRSLEQLHEVDMKPFEAGIRAGAPSVLVSHNIVSAIDGNLPASLSPRIHRILREDMDFKGVIITDDLSMGAIADYFPKSGGAVEAIMAGNDVLCTGEYKKQYPAVLAAVADGTISEDRIDQSVRRVLRWKIELGLIDASSN